MKAMVKKLTLYFVLLNVLLITICSSSYATSWKVMETKEVIDKAELIVVGKYEKQSNKSKGMWVPFDFVVDKYYRGTGANVIKASIEQFDVPNTLNYQAKGGKYILFLQKDPEGSRLMVPVGGPNGMIKYNNGDIEANGFYNTEVIKDFLSQQKAIEPKSITEETSILLIVLPLFTIVLLIIGRIKGTKVN